jgi:hypothetical protein
MAAPAFRVPAFLALSLLSCGAGAVAEGVRPAMPTAKDALGEASCPIVVDRLVPLIVDWRQDQRGEIEAQLAEAKELPVVAYDCKTIRLLPDCHIEGQYGYVGVAKDEQVVQLKSADEVSANLPKTGVALGVEMSADLARGSAVDLALVMVGRFSDDARPRQARGARRRVPGGDALPPRRGGRRVRDERRQPGDRPLGRRDLRRRDVGPEPELALPAHDQGLDPEVRRDPAR